MLSQSSDAATESRQMAERKLSTTYPVRIAASVTEEQARALRRLVLSRKQEDESLPIRWGVSDLVREIIENYLATLGAEKSKVSERNDKKRSQNKNHARG